MGGGGRAGGREGEGLRLSYRRSDVSFSFRHVFFFLTSEVGIRIDEAWLLTFLPNLGQLCLEVEVAGSRPQALQTPFIASVVLIVNVSFR